MLRSTSGFLCEAQSTFYSLSVLCCANVEWYVSINRKPVSIVLFFVSTVYIDPADEDWDGVKWMGDVCESE